MTIGHLKEKRQFKPNPKIRGGSKGGDKRPPWPLFIKVMAETVYRQWAGTGDAIIEDRRGMPTKEFWASLCALLPGLPEWCAENRPNGPDRWAHNLRNRAYKMYYNGTSARGKDHDPRTRAAVSLECWRQRAPAGHPWLKLSDNIARGTVRVVSDWQDQLGEDF